VQWFHLCKVHHRCLHSLSFDIVQGSSFSPTDHVRAIIFLIGFAELAFQACLDLSTHTDAVPNFDSCHFVPDLDSLANDFMTDADGKGAVSPAAGDSVHIGTTHTATLDLDINVTVFERLWFEL